jgi:hypothetical protein
MSEKSGTDARFPYELRQAVVVGCLLRVIVNHSPASWSTDPNRREPPRSIR